jgi:hypothetical protein
MPRKEATLQLKRKRKANGKAETERKDRNRKLGPPTTQKPNNFKINLVHHNHEN